MQGISAANAAMEREHQPGAVIAAAWRLPGGACLWALAAAVLFG
jgi:hypothetical protein